MIKLARFVATIFYFVGILGALILYGRLNEFNQAMGSFFGMGSFSVVTNTFIFIFLLVNIALGLVIHLLAEILHFIILIYVENKNSNTESKSRETSINTISGDSASLNDTRTDKSLHTTTHEKEELNLFYKTLLKMQNIFQKK